jgi:hypothetical protein
MIAVLQNGGAVGNSLMIAIIRSKGKAFALNANGAAPCRLKAKQRT